MNKLAAMMPLLIQGTTVNRIVLNRLVYFADLAHLLKHGATISGREQLKLTHGPAAMGYFDERQSAVRAGFLIETEKETPFEREFSYSVPEGIDLSPVQNLFAASELAVIAAVRENLGGKSAKFLGSAAHRFEPWESAPFGWSMEMDRAKEDVRLRTWLAEHNLARPD